MYEQTDWPDRIYIEEKNHPKHQEGYMKGEGPKVINKKKELILEKYLDSRIDKPLLICIYLLQEGKDECILDKRALIENAQGYANSGFDDLYEMLTKSHDMVISLANFLIETMSENQLESNSIGDTSDS